MEDVIYKPIEEITTCGERIKILMNKNKRNFYNISCNKSYFKRAGYYSYIFKENLTYVMLGKLIGVSGHLVKDWTLNIHKPSMKYFNALSKLFNVSADWILAEEYINYKYKDKIGGKVNMVEEVIFDFTPIEEVNTTAARLNILFGKAKRKYYGIECNADMFKKRGIEHYLNRHILTDRIFGDIISASKSSVNNWMLGKSVPRMQYLETISLYFNVSVDWLLCRTNTLNKLISVELEVEKDGEFKIFEKYGFTREAYIKLKSMKDNNKDTFTLMNYINNMIIIS